MGEPVRLQLSRRKGFNLQAHSLATNGLPAVNVARPSAWGNPYKVGDPKWDPITGRRTGTLSAAEAVEKYRRRECSSLRSAEIAKLRGKNLACWCAPSAPCHADALIELAKAETTMVATTTIGRRAGQGAG